MHGQSVTNLCPAPADEAHRSLAAGHVMHWVVIGSIYVLYGMAHIGSVIIMFCLWYQDKKENAGREHELQQKHGIRIQADINVVYISLFV